MGSPSHGHAPGGEVGRGHPTQVEGSVPLHVWTRTDRPGRHFYSATGEGEARFDDGYAPVEGSGGPGGTPLAAEGSRLIQRSRLRAPGTGGDPVRVTSDLVLQGERVRLRSTTADDRAALVAIRATEEVRRRWRGDDLEAELDDDLADDDVELLTIESAEGRVVGLIQFSEETDPEYRHASLDLFVDPAVHRQGIATDAIRTLADFLFDRRGHHRLTIDPAADNVAAIECYAKVGFEPVGVLRSYERQADGTWADGLLMDMLATDRRQG
jgi:aminoglycoside 6'-N-acetyltransferase